MQSSLFLEFKIPNFKQDAFFGKGVFFSFYQNKDKIWLEYKFLEGRNSRGKGERQRICAGGEGVIHEDSSPSGSPAVCSPGLCVRKSLCFFLPEGHLHLDPWVLWILVAFHYGHVEEKYSSEDEWERRKMSNISRWTNLLPHDIACHSYILTFRCSVSTTCDLPRDKDSIADFLQHRLVIHAHHLYIALNSVKQATIWK